MKTLIPTSLRKAAAGLAILALTASQALALPVGVAQPAMPAATDGAVVLASGDCYALGMQQAAREGGTLAKATPEVRNGRQVCVIVVMLPARDGNRPVVSTTVIPLG